MAKKSNKNADIYPPLELLKRETSKHPRVWEQMAYIHERKGTEGLPVWPDWCYAPIGAALSITMGNLPDTIENRINAMKDSQSIAALAPWRHSKEVFVMDEGLQELLFEQADDLKIIPEMLLHLPYMCFYIQFAPNTKAKSKELHGVHGVFVHLEYDVDTHSRELRLLYLWGDGDVFGLQVSLDAETVEEGFQLIMDSAARNLPPERTDLKRALFDETEARMEYAEFYKQTVQLVLYLCAQNAEITPNEEQATHTKRGQVIKDRYAEIRKWDVGVRIGNAVRAYRRSADKWSKDHEGEAPAGHASPRPHMRRGHWHSFWTGKKDGSEERKIVLKWVAPTFVNADTDDESPVVLHHVKESPQYIIN